MFILYPTFGSLNTAIRELAQRGDGQRCEQLLNETTNQYHATKTYNAIFSSITQALGSGSGQTSLQIFRYMQRRGVEPNAYTYNTLLDILESSHNDEGAWEVMEEMKEEGIPRDTQRTHRDTNNFDNYTTGTQTDDNSNANGNENNNAEDNSNFVEQGS